MYAHHASTAARWSMRGVRESRDATGRSNGVHFMSVLLISSRARAVQDGVQQQISLLRRRAFRDVCAR
eukprot:1580576-Lingulodinium_polyedra.AAC.1